MNEAYDFKFEQFEFQEEWEKLQGEIEKPNILICGATGSGKSSAVNHVFGKNFASVGGSRPTTRGIKRYTSDDSGVVLYDSEGYEIGDENQSNFKQMIWEFVDERLEMPINEHIHLVWYCISAANKRVTELDISTIKGFIDKGVSVAVLLTKIDSVDLEELSDLKKAIKNDLNFIDLFTLSIEDIPKEYNQWKELLKWSTDSLSDNLKDGFIQSLIREVDQKHQHVKFKVIPKYTTLSAGVALSPIPLSDAVLLVPIQARMCMKILQTYNVGKMGHNITTLIQSTIISQMGRKAATYLTASVAKFVPGVGTAGGMAINAVVASSFTYALGMICDKVAYEFVSRRISGEDIGFIDVFNSIDMESLFFKYFNHFQREKNKDIIEQ